MQGPWPIPCRSDMFVSCKKQLSWCFLCKPRATWNEMGLYLCWKLVMCQCVCWYVLVCVSNVLVCVSTCSYVFVCVVLPVASVLASMRWRLCRGDGSKKNDFCNFKKKSPAREFIPITVLIHSKNLKTASKTITSAPRISVIILAQMVCST